MFADKWLLKFLFVMVVAAAVLAGLRLHLRYREKTIPAFGGAELSVQLADNAHFLQNDPRWAAERMGNPNGDTLQRAGCTIASVAMALTNLGHSFDPGQLNTALTANNGYTSRSWLIWGAISRVTKGGARAVVYREPSQKRLDACLKRGDYPIVKFRIADVIPHWVVVVGKRQGTYYIRDPLIKEPAPIPLTRRTQVLYSVRCIRKVKAKPSAPAQTPEAPSRTN
ncbi:MAG: hypothetical protein P8Y47_00590 [Alphaproteobacteria bacterium]